MQKFNFKGALFDLDGTLADNYSAIHLCTCAAFRKFGVPEPSLEKIVSTVGGSILITMKRLLAGSQYESLYEKIADLYLELYPNFVFCGLKAMPFAEETLSAVRASGVKIACFTNKQTEGAEQVLGFLGLDKYLDCVVSTTLHSPRKPDKDFTEFALKKIGLPASAVVGIGDSPFDYQAARVCSVASALVCTGGDSKQSLVQKCPEAIGVFDNLKDLATAIFSVDL